MKTIANRSFRSFLQIFRAYYELLVLYIIKFIYIVNNRQNENKKKKDYPIDYCYKLIFNIKFFDDGK